MGGGAKKVPGRVDFADPAGYHAVLAVECRRIFYVPRFPPIRTEATVGPNREAVVKMRATHSFCRVLCSRRIPNMPQPQGLKSPAPAGATAVPSPRPPAPWSA